MKKGIILSAAVLLILFSTVSAGAQARLEVNVNWPITIGINSSNSLFSGANVDLSQYHFLLPDFRAYYQFGGDGLLRGGIGIRAYSVIIQSFIFPEAFVELNLNPVMLEASLGGYVFGFFGLFNHLSTADLMLPDSMSPSSSCPGCASEEEFSCSPPLAPTGTRTSCTWATSECASFFFRNKRRTTRPSGRIDPGELEAFPTPNLLIGFLDGLELFLGHAHELGAQAGHPVRVVLDGQLPIGRLDLLNVRIGRHSHDLPRRITPVHELRAHSAEGPVFHPQENGHAPDLIFFSRADAAGVGSGDLEKEP